MLLFIYPSGRHGNKEKEKISWFSQTNRGSKNKRIEMFRILKRRCSILFLVSLFSVLPRGSSSPRSFRQSRRELKQMIVDYFPYPELEWMVRLDVDVNKGNAVVQSPFNEEVLYVTTKSGSLVVLSSIDGKTLATVKPTPRSLTNNGKVENWSLYSTSGISFATTSSGKKFLVYSIVDEPPVISKFVFGPKSRVVAVSIPQHKIIWTSTGLPGTPSGSPLVYVSRKESGNTPYICVTHNSRTSNVNNSTIQTGHITLLNSGTGNVLWTESEWARDDPPKGYGPPGLASEPLNGMYSGGAGNSNDMVVWTSNDGEGRGEVGHTFAFQLPKGFKETTDQMTGLKATVLKVVGWNSVTRPVFNKNGTNMFVGVTGSELRGWTGNARFDQTADWSANIFSNTIDPEAAIPTTPLLSKDENRLFVSSASFDLASVKARNGKPNWKVKGTSPFISEARASPDDKRVYVAQSADGRIFSYDQLTGELLWESSCDQFEEDCSNSVRADFDLSSTGQFLFFSDVKGRLICLKLGRLMGLYGPTASPAWANPSLPTRDIDWAQDQAEETSSDGTGLGGTITLIVLATLIAIGSSMYIIMINRRKRALNLIIEEPYPDIDEYPIPHDPNGPDPYEDSMIIQHSPKHNGSGGFDDDYNNMPHFFNPVEDSITIASSAPADRISVLMGTSNRIAPIREDFSYGASVLV